MANGKNQSLFRTREPEEIINTLALNIYPGPTVPIEEYKIKFPLLSLCEDNFDPETIRKNFISIQGKIYPYSGLYGPIIGYTGNLMSPNGIITMTDEDYDNYDFLSERMNEAKRINYSSELSPSVINVWNTETVSKEAARIIYNEIKDNPDSFDYCHVRKAYDVLSSNQNIDRPFVMRLSWIKTILLSLFGKDLSRLSIHDPIMGSGEVFLASSLLKAKFSGTILTDPEALDKQSFIGPDFSAIANTFGSKSQKIEQVLSDALPNKVEHRIHDVIMTSFSPFMGRGGQKYGSFSDWFCWKILGSLTRAWNSLNVGGYLVFHTRDYDRYDVIDALLLAIQQILPKSSWHAMYMLQDSKVGKNYAVYIFRKVDINVNKIKIPERYGSRRTFAERYPELRDKYVDLLMMNEIQEFTRVNQVEGSISREIYEQAWGSITESLLDFILQLPQDERVKGEYLFKKLFMENPWRFLLIVTVLNRSNVHIWLNRIYSTFKD